MNTPVKKQRVPMPVALQHRLGIPRNAFQKNVRGACVALKGKLSYSPGSRCKRNAETDDGFLYWKPPSDVHKEALRKVMLSGKKDVLFLEVDGDDTFVRGFFSVVAETRDHFQLTFQAPWLPEEESLYHDGVTYHSKLEIQFAKFFQALDVPFWYEPATFNLGLVKYTPDFFLPLLQAYVEVKPTYPTESEIALCEQVAKMGISIYLAYAGSVKPSHAMERASKSKYGFRPHSDGIKVIAWDSSGVRMEGLVPVILESGAFAFDTIKTSDDVRWMHPALTAAYENVV
jgi:hypothetical protein